jgi:hypothetical protein
MRENSYYMEENDLVPLRRKFPKILDEVGRCKVVDKRDEKRFKLIAGVQYNSDVANILLDCWRYFEVLSIFKLDEDITFNMILEDQTKFFQFKEISFILDKFSDFIIGRTLDNNEIRVDYSSANTPLLEKVKALAQFAI